MDPWLNRVRQVAALSVSCALLGGAIEVAATAYRKVALGRIEFVSPDFVWMTPLAFVVLIVPVAIAIAILSELARQPLQLATWCGLLAGTLVFSILLPYTMIAWWASMALALGLGVRTMRWAATVDPALLGRRVGGPAVAVVVVLVVAAAVTRAPVLWHSDATIAASPASAEAPNVLLIVLDTVRASNLGAYGYRRPTSPTLTRMAAEGVAFDFAISTAPWTLPSHGSLFTGLAAGATRGDWRRPMARDMPVLAEVLASRGYATAGFVANHLYTSYESGLDRGFQHYDDYRVTLGGLLKHASLARIDARANRSDQGIWRNLRTVLGSFHFATANGRRPAEVSRSADDVAAAFLDWQANYESRPFFAFLNLFDAHLPHRAPQAFVETFRGGPSRPIDTYDAAIAWLDHVVGTVLNTLETRGVLDRTIVVVTSDHGEQFGEHGLEGHANSLYLELIHVPLLIRYPRGVPAAVRVGYPITLRDLPATILDLAGAPAGELPGSTLTSTWRGGGGSPSVVVSELGQGINASPPVRNHSGNMVSRIDQRFHYIRNGDGSDELFDYRADPAELTNLAADARFEADLLRLRDGLPTR